MYPIDVVRAVDPEVADAIQAEIDRQENRIELIASENFASIPVMSAENVDFSSGRYSSVSITSISARALS